MYLLGELWQGTKSIRNSSDHSDSDCLAVSGCLGGELPVANTSGFDYREVAFQFTEALTERDYDRAYAMTSQDYQRCISVERLGTAFEPIDN